MNTKELLETRFRENEIPVSAAAAEKLAAYLDLLEAWNRRMDLTAVLTPEETADRHFVDSLLVLKTGLLASAETVIDVGTGAGFPGLALALACPEKRFTLLDSLRKRLDFLRAVCKETGAQNVTLVHLRAEDGGRDPRFREKFDAALARAVAPLNVLCEYLLPFVRPGGKVLCWKGPALAEELEAGRRAAHLLGGRAEPPVSCPISGRDWDHRILPVLKVQPCPKAYPRKAGTPKTRPLGL